MKLSPEQLVEWFFTANSALAAGRDQYLAMLRSPPSGTKRSEVVSGLKQGINDTLTMAKDMPDEERRQIDASLRAKGLPSLRRMEATLKRKHEKILSRGEIKNDEEFHIVAEILSDLEFEISASDRAKLGKISYAYENRAK